MAVLLRNSLAWSVILSQQWRMSIVGAVTISKVYGSCGLPYWCQTLSLLKVPCISQQFQATVLGASNLQRDVRLSES
jgi:hypothetical protein